MEKEVTTRPEDVETTSAPYDGYSFKPYSKKLLRYGSDKDKEDEDIFIAIHRVDLMKVCKLSESTSYLLQVVAGNNVYEEVFNTKKNALFWVKRFTRLLEDVK